MKTVYVSWETMSNALRDINCPSLDKLLLMFEEKFNCKIALHLGMPDEKYAIAFNTEEDAIWFLLKWS